MRELPNPVAVLVEKLAAMPGASAVVLGGSRALGIDDAGSDWDIGLYYRGSIDLTILASYGSVHPPGSWGRLMNGGAWLQIDGHRVDVLLRDLDTVNFWTQRAEQGDFELDALLGYIAGMPTYTLMAELACCRVLQGSIPTVAYPPRLAATAPARWRFCSLFSLAYARTHAERGNIAGALGQIARAIMEESHARLCERSQWVCNEKRLIEAAGLGEMQGLFKCVPSEITALSDWIDQVSEALGAARDEAAPWKIA